MDEWMNEWQKLLYVHGSPLTLHGFSYHCNILSDPLVLSIYVNIS